MLIVYFSAIFERLRNVLHEGQIDIRVQYMMEVMFAVRKDHFKVKNAYFLERWYLFIETAKADRKLSFIFKRC